MDPILSSTDFSQLRAFVAVAEVLNFTRAAERLDVTSSALSQLVRGLEDKVGVRLLNRSTLNVSLTEAGERLLEQVRPAVDQLAVALGQTSQLREHPAGLVRVHCFRTAADLFIRPILRSFNDTYPDVILDVTIDDEVVDIVSGRYDVAIRIGEVIERDMVAIKLGPELRQIAVASPDYLKRRGAPEHPRDLLSHSCIGWRWPGHEVPYKWEFVEDGQWFDVGVQGPIIANSKEFCIHAALDGVGIAFPTDQLSAPYVAEGRLVRLLERWSAPFPGFFLCYPQQRNMAPAVRAFIDSVRSNPASPFSINN